MGAGSSSLCPHNATVHRIEPGTFAPEEGDERGVAHGLHLSA